MENTLVGQSLLYAAIFSVIVLIIFWFEYRRIRSRLMKREEQMKHRMYELSILREIGARTGYSLNVPIVINGRAAGILTVASTETGLYHTSEEVEILYTIVNQASDAVSKLQTVLEIEKGKLN